MPICCKTCDGKGGWINDDSAPDFCGDSDIEECYECHGTGFMTCDVCGEHAQVIIDGVPLCEEDAK